MSAPRAVLSETKFSLPSTDSRGGSFKSVFMPSCFALISSLFPTLPTPMIPSVLLDRLKLYSFDKFAIALITYSATAFALQPWADENSISLSSRKD